jgi:hypothetical protein
LPLTIFEPCQTYLFCPYSAEHAENERALHSIVGNSRIINRSHRGAFVPALARGWLVPILH